MFANAIQLKRDPHWVKETQPDAWCPREERTETTPREENVPEQRDPREVATGGQKQRLAWCLDPGAPGGRQPAGKSLSRSLERSWPADTLIWGCQTQFLLKSPVHGDVSQRPWAPNGHCLPSWRCTFYKRSHIEASVCVCHSPVSVALGIHWLFFHSF